MKKSVSFQMKVSKNVYDNLVKLQSEMQLKNLSQHIYLTDVTNKLIKQFFGTDNIAWDIRRVPPNIARYQVSIGRKFKYDLKRFAAFYGLGFHQIFHRILYNYFIEKEG